MDENKKRVKQRGYDDLPAKEDRLGLRQYFTGLAEFIKKCPTPMTIAIQGGWGSGKTSAMRIIQEELTKNADEKKAAPDRLQYLAVCPRCPRGAVYPAFAADAPGD